jgi:type VI secretion system protein ImpJ
MGDHSLQLSVSRGDEVLKENLRYRKVVWHDGTFVTPEHFPQLNRYHEKLLHTHIDAIDAFRVGIIQLDCLFDGESVEIKTYRAIMPGGEVVDIPDVDDPPDIRSDIPAGDQIDVYLGMRETSSLLDVMSVDNREDWKVELEKKDLRILFSGEESDGYRRLKIAELVRSDATEDMSLNEKYVPRLFYFSASPYLMRLLGGLIATLIDKRKELSEVCLPDDEKQALYSIEGVEMLVALTIQTLSRSIPVLRHFHRQLGGKVHPEVVFRELSSLAGELSSFVVDADAENLPEYKYSDLSTAFTDLTQKIETFLDLVQPKRRWEKIELEKADEDLQGLSRFYSEELANKAIDGSQLYLGVNASNTTLIDRITKQKTIRRITAPDRIDEYIRQPDLPTGTAENRLAEITVIHRLPRMTPMKEGHQYFLVRTDSVDWEDILRQNKLAIGIPAGETEIELVAIRN